MGRMLGAQRLLWIRAARCWAPPGFIRAKVPPPHQPPHRFPSLVLGTGGTHRTVSHFPRNSQSRGTPPQHLHPLQGRSGWHRHQVPPTWLLCRALGCCARTQGGLDPPLLPILQGPNTYPSRPDPPVGSWWKGDRDWGSPVVLEKPCKEGDTRLGTGKGHHALQGGEIR